MKWQYFKWFVPIVVVLLVGLFGVRKVMMNPHTKAPVQAVQAHVKKTKPTKKKAPQQAVIDWRKPSENKPYPDVNQYPNLEFVVSTAKQRVYLKAAGKTLYTMYASTGVNHATPTGHYAIQAERGLHFFNPEVQVGANYYTSWLDHGTYLFHSVPTDANGHYIAAQAAKLGKKPGSHGCIRLSVPDAKWIYTNAKVGMPVIVE
ncbi:L,D-transpeptidase [Lacticaseibacillus sp. N501-2]|uniref:L,D-transpeptidase n=1 Tax=Lacticaseibacillus salsurae TaxID=3367729 RepID=UPI0038B3787B